MRWVKDPASSLQRFGLLLWHRFDPWSGNFHMPWVRPEKKKKKKVWKIYIPKRSVVLIYYINLLPLFEAQIGN